VPRNTCNDLSMHSGHLRRPASPGVGTVLSESLEVLRIRAVEIGGALHIFWLWLAQSWDGWRDSLIVVKPETVVRWHRQGFKYYWAWKSPTSAASDAPCGCLPGVRAYV
jgi:hypothetical protein